MKRMILLITVLLPIQSMNMYAIDGNDLDFACEVMSQWTVPVLLVTGAVVWGVNKAYEQPKRDVSYSAEQLKYGLLYHMNVTSITSHRTDSVTYSFSDGDLEQLKKYHNEKHADQRVAGLYEGLSKEVSMDQFFKECDRVRRNQ